MEITDALVDIHVGGGADSGMKGIIILCFFWQHIGVIAYYCVQYRLLEYYIILYYHTDIL